MGAIIKFNRPLRNERYGVLLAHAAPGGGPVLKGAESWRTVSGVCINMPRWHVWLYFRRAAS